jgi:hypothetical protein
MFKKAKKKKAVFVLILVFTYPWDVTIKVGSCEAIVHRQTAVSHLLHPAW